MRLPETIQSGHGAFTERKRVRYRLYMKIITAFINVVYFLHEWFQVDLHIRFARCTPQAAR